jgi:preprotein translocase subunit SecF
MSLRRGFRLFRGQEEFHADIVGHRRIWFLISGLLLVVSVAGLLLRGLNLSVDFTGGALLEYENRAELTTQQVAGRLAQFGREGALVQLTDGGDTITVRTEPLGEERADVLADLADQAGIELADISVTDIGPRWGQQISAKAVQGLVVFLILVSIYLAFRFEWKMAVSAIVTMIHDLLITAGVYALVGREVTPETVIALLTILGYSLYDTVVIFDKIKENAESLSLVARETYAGAVNLSLNQVLMRSVNTALTTLVPIGTLLLFGGETLQDFAFALFMGVGIGTYSSIFWGAPILAVLKEREPKLAEIRARAARRRLQPVPAEGSEPIEPAEPTPAAVGASPTVRPGGTRSTPPRRRPKKKSRAKRRGR